VEIGGFGLPRIDVLLESRRSCGSLSIEPLLEDLGKLNLDCIDWVSSRREWAELSADGSCLRSLNRDQAARRRRIFLQAVAALLLQKGGSSWTARSFREFPTPRVVTPANQKKQTL